MNCCSFIANHSRISIFNKYIKKKVCNECELGNYKTLKAMLRQNMEVEKLIFNMANNLNIAKRRSRFIISNQ